jgi:hypothetical protein
MNPFDIATDGLLSGAAIGIASSGFVYEILLIDWTVESHPTPNSFVLVNRLPPYNTVTIAARARKRV